MQSKIMYCFPSLNCTIPVSLANPTDSLTGVSHTFKDRISCETFASVHLNQLHHNQNILEGKEWLYFYVLPDSPKVTWLLLYSFMKEGTQVHAYQ